MQILTKYDDFIDQSFSYVKYTSFNKALEMLASLEHSALLLCSALATHYNGLVTDPTRLH